METVNSEKPQKQRFNFGAKEKSNISYIVFFNEPSQGSFQIAGRKKKYTQSSVVLTINSGCR